MKKLKKMLAWLGTFAVGLAAVADPTVTINSVRQNYPWNNTVEINYTIGGTKASSSTLYALQYSYSTTAGGTKTSIASSALSGTSMTDSDNFAIGGPYTAVWTAPEGISADAAELKISVEDVTEQGTPATEDNANYMVVWLESGKVYYRYWANQATANTAYNTEEYKTTKMVFRKVPVGTYTIGDSTNYSSSNGSKSWNLANYNNGKSYWIGVFQVTQYQYNLIGSSAGSTPSNFQTYTTSGTFPDTYSGSTTGLRPVEKVSWNDVRDSSTGSSIVLGNVETKSDGTFLQRLNAKTSAGAGITGFDLPTEVMFEIAERAGATSVYWWGTSANSASPWYAISSANSGSRTVEVGRTNPNAWGLYDMAGNVWEWCLDTSDLSNLANASGPYSPSAGSSSDRRSRGGSYWSNAPSSASFRASSRNGTTASGRGSGLGFRVARLCP